VPLLLLALFLKVASLYAKAKRWAFIVSASGEAHPRHRVFAATVWGAAGNIILPAKLGEVARVSLLCRYNRLPIGFGVSTTGVGYLVDFATLVLALLVIGIPSSGLNLVDYGRVTTALCVLSVVTLVLAGLPFLSRRTRVIGRISGLLPLALRRRAALAGQSLQSGLAVLRQPSTLAIVSLAAVAIWSLEFTAVDLALSSFHLPHGPLLTLLLLAAFHLAFAFPVTPGNLGTHQLVCVLVLGCFAITPSQAIAFSCGWQASVHSTILLLAFGVWCQEALRSHSSTLLDSPTT
jgi:uncharacterized protein (TIRG00374 family)